MKPATFPVGHAIPPLLADTFGSVFLVLLVVGFAGGLVGLWFVSRSAPKGTVLAIAACVYVASWLIVPGDNRALHGLVGFLRLFGFAGGVLGVFDLVKKSRAS